MQEWKKGASLQGPDKHGCVLVDRNRKVSMKNVERKICQRPRMVPDDGNEERRSGFSLPEYYFPK